MMGFLAVIGPVIRVLGLAEWHAGLAVTAAGLAWTFLSRPWGRASDKFGRKPILLLGVGGFALTYFALAVFLDYALAAPQAIYSSVALLMLTRGLIGAFNAAVPPVSAALIADRIESERRAVFMAKLGAANGVGMILGPAGAALLAGIGLVVPLYAFAGLPALGLIVIVAMIPSAPRRAAAQRPTLRLFDFRIRLPVVAALVSATSLVVAQLCLGFLILDRLGFDFEDGARMTSYILVGVGISLTAAQIAVSRLEGVAPERWLAIGAFIASASFITAGFADSASLIILSMCSAAAGMGLILPSFQALAANLVSREEQGAAAGTVSAAQGIAMVLAPIAVTSLYGISPSIPFSLSGFALLGLGVTALIASKSTGGSHS